MRMKAEFDQIIKKYGYDVLYVRRDERFQCSCFSERSGGAKGNCPKCLGTGRKINIERIKIRRKHTSIPETMSGASGVEEIGNMSSSHYVYYLQSEYEPKEQDLILEVEWSETGVKKIKQKHLVSAVEGKRGNNGVLQFYQVYTKEMLVTSIEK